MPLYTYKCGCGHKSTRFSSIKNYQSTLECGLCGGMAERFIDAAPMVKGDYPGYSCPISGAWIEGRKAHEENLKKHGCRVFEPGETQEMMARKKASEEAFEASVEATAEEFIANLSHADQQSLACGLDHGLDIEVSRITTQN